MARRENPKVLAVTNMLPADGSAVNHAVWRQTIIEAGDFSLLNATQLARREGAVIFEIGDYEDPVGTLTVRRALIEAQPATRTTPRSAAAAPAAAPVKEG